MFLILPAAVVVAFLLLAAPLESFVSHPTRLYHYKNEASSLIILHDIPTLLSNLLTQPYSPDVVGTAAAQQMTTTIDAATLSDGGTILNEVISKPSLNYAPAATTLFVNMLTPASILAAAMISLGMKKPFELSVEMKQDAQLKEHIESLRRAYIVVTLISFCSELLAVMWGTVAVNQLTERNDVLPSSSVWELLQRDVDLEWAAVNSHFVMGLIGFMYMVGIRGYVMLIAAGASEALIVSTLSGVGAALLLMVSIVNRGVEAGGGDGVGYGSNILDLFGHYINLLYERAKGVQVMRDVSSPTSVGPLAMLAIVLELMSVGFALYATLSPLFDGDMETASAEKKSFDNKQQELVDVVNGTRRRISSDDERETTNDITSASVTNHEIDIPPSPS